ncbi:hypothetical protein ACOSQ2_015611 [Xanthoceras sorbifolium]
MKKLHDKKHAERQFQVGDFIYLKLQPYRQSSVVGRRNYMLSARYFGSFEVLGKIGSVAYRLKLPHTIKNHQVYHVSQLKKKIGQDQPMMQDHLQMVINDSIVPVPRVFLEQRIRKEQKEIWFTCKDCHQLKLLGSLNQLLKNILQRLASRAIA